MSIEMGETMRESETFHGTSHYKEEGFGPCLGEEPRSMQFLR